MKLSSSIQLKQDFRSGGQASKSSSLLISVNLSNIYINVLHNWFMEKNNYGKLTRFWQDSKSKLFFRICEKKVEMENYTSFPYSIVRFCTMNAVQVLLNFWTKTFILYSQKKEVLEICSIACEKYTGGEKKWVLYFDLQDDEVSLTIIMNIFRERQPELAASTILNSLKEKVKWWLNASLELKMEQLFYILIHWFSVRRAMARHCRGKLQHEHHVSTRFYSLHEFRR